MAVAATVLVLALAGACSGDDGDALPGCAGDLPVPDGLDIVDTATADQADGEASCVITLAGDEPLRETVAAWETSLEADGWSHTRHPAGGQSTVLRLRSPDCGLVMVFAPGSDRVSAKVPPDRTPTLVTMLPCHVLPEGEPTG